MLSNSGLEFSQAVEEWWASKEKNANSTKKTQGGERDSVLRGDTMDGFRNLLVEKLIKYGVREDDIYYGNTLSSIPANLPGYYRANKNWDLVVCANALHKGEGKTPVLIAAVELRSQKKSIGNNQQNRIEEALGSVTDLRRAWDEGLISRERRPWVGYLFLGVYEDNDVSKPVQIKQPLFPVDCKFIHESESSDMSSQVKVKGISYLERYKLFLDRMTISDRFDAACFLVTNERMRGEAKVGKGKNYTVLYEDFSDNKFVDSLLRQIKGQYPV